MKLAPGISIHVSPFGWLKRTCVEDFMSAEDLAPKPVDPMAPTPGQIDIFGNVVGETGTSGYPGAAS